MFVGHSFGGIPISGAAEVVASRIKRLIYLDALVVQPGKSAFDGLPAEIVTARKKAAQDTSGGLSLRVPPPAAFAELGVAQEPRDTDETNCPARNTAKIRRADTTGASGEGNTAPLHRPPRTPMFQLIGGLLAFFAITSVLAGSPIAGTVFALATFIWVVVANLRRRERTTENADPWGAIYEARFSR